MNVPRQELTLRTLRLDDVPRIHEWTSQPQASRYQTWSPHRYEDTVRFVEAALAAADMRPQRRWVWGGVSDDEGLMGIGDVARHSDSTFEISYSVHADLWGRGMGTSLAHSLIAWTFSTFGDAERIEATCDPRNAGSAKVLTRVGMTYEGWLRHTLLLPEGWRDSKIFSILRGEWADGVG